MIIADMDGVRPEDVTWKRIGFEIAALRGPNRRHIEVVRASARQEPPAAAKVGESATESVASEPPSPAVETIASQIQTLRKECNWTIEKLAWWSPNPSHFSPPLTQLMYPGAKASQGEL